MKEKISKLIEISQFLNDNEELINLKYLEDSLNDNSYILSIMGQFSAGKSSLINNLFGEKVLPVHKTETTACITFIKYGSEEKVELLYTDGHIETISIDESLKMWQTGEKADLINDVKTINIFIPSDILKNGLIIADTPGINTVIDKHIELTESLITSSDGIIYVLGKQITEADINFIEAIKKYGTPITFVRTFLDQIRKNEENSDATIEKERGLLSEISSGEVFFVSNEPSSDFYSEIFSLQAYVSCKIAENTTKARLESIENRLSHIAKKFESRVIDRSGELDLCIKGEKDEYLQNKIEIEKTLEKLELSLARKKEVLHANVEKAKINANDNLTMQKSKEEKILINKINQALDNSITLGLQEVIGQAIRESCIRMRDGFVEPFDNIIRENKVEFIEEMKQNNDLSVWIPDLPDNMDESSLQVESLIEKRTALLELQSALREELESVNTSNQNLELQVEEIEEERKAIHEALGNIQEQLDSFPPYVARYVMVEGDHTFEKSFKVVGDIVDWATIFIPGPTWAKLGGKILNGASKGAKVLKAVKAADAFADGARILAKVAKGASSGKKVAKTASKFEKGARVVVDTIDVINKGKKAILTNKIEKQVAINENDIDFNPNVISTNPSCDYYLLANEPRPNILDYIGLDYWFAKLGKQFDVPDTKKVDIEYENKYYTAKHEIEREMKLQVRKEFEKRKQQEELKNKEEENILLKEITARKERAAQDQIKELEREIAKEKKLAVSKFIREYYISAVEENLNHMEHYIRTDLLKEIEEKMIMYIDTYDFKIVEDINKKRQELEEIERKFNSSEKEELENEITMCKEYVKFLEAATV